MEDEHERPPTVRESGLNPLITLHERGDAPVGSHLTDALRHRYGGDLVFPRRTGRPHVISNFVSTLDGVVSYGIPGRSGGGEISGFDDADRFVMGLLRSCADAVLFASGTLHADAGHIRTAEFIYPPAAALYAEHREQLHASFLEARLVDELFLTVAPQVASRNGERRPGLADGIAFRPEAAPWFDLISVKRAGHHLFLRLADRR